MWWEEKTKVEQQVFEPQQWLLGKDKTITHLKAKHPHQTLDVTWLEDEKSTLQKKRQHYVQLEQKITHTETREEQERREKMKWKQQKESLEMLYKKIEEKDQFVKDKEHLLKEYKEMLAQTAKLKSRTANKEKRG